MSQVIKGKISKYFKIRIDMKTTNGLVAAIQ